MNMLLWIVAGQLAVVFLATGAMKLLRTKENLWRRTAWVGPWTSPALS